MLLNLVVYKNNFQLMFQNILYKWMNQNIHSNQMGKHCIIIHFSKYKQGMLNNIIHYY